MVRRTFDITVDTKQIEKFAEDFVKNYGPAVTTALARSAKAVEAQIVRNIRTSLSRDSRGDLARSWQASGVYFNEEKQASIDVFSPLDYAMIHDAGGVIYPSKAKALAIPNKENTRFFGVVNRDFKSPSQLTASQNAELWLDKKTGTLKDGKGKVAYFLKYSVTMPARWYVRDAVTQSLEEVQKVFDQAVAEVVAAEGS